MCLSYGILDEKEDFYLDQIFIQQNNILKSIEKMKKAIENKIPTKAEKQNETNRKGLH